MKRLQIGCSILLLAAVGFSLPAMAGGDDDRELREVCYEFDNFPTDFLILKIDKPLVTGRYRQCVVGASPGTGSADALMVGTIQRVPEGNTIPFSPFNSTVRKQIALTGSIATGNFGGGDPDKASQCWLHLVFQDYDLTQGHAIGACGWFFNAPPNLYDSSDDFAEPISRIACEFVEEFDGTCSD